LADAPNTSLSSWQRILEATVAEVLARLVLLLLAVVAAAFGVGFLSGRLTQPAKRIKAVKVCYVRSAGPTGPTLKLIPCPPPNG